MAETLDNLNKQIKNQKDNADKELKDEQSEAAVKAEKNKAVPTTPRKSREPSRRPTRKRRTLKMS